MLTKNLIETSGSKLSLNLHKGQSRAMRSMARFVAIIAGTQSGKTSFLPWWLLNEIAACGPGDYLAVTSSYDLFKLKFLPAMRETFEHTLGIGRYWSGAKLIELAEPDGSFLANTADDRMHSRIILRSAASPSGLESSTARAAVLDEAGQDEFTLEAWEAVQRRLSLNRGRCLIATTPYNLGWLKTQIYDKWERGDADYEVIQFASTLNPLFPQAEIERARRTLPPHRFEMFYMGRFSKPAGLIYDVYDETLHLVEPFEVPREWRRVVGMDFGGANTAKIFIAQNPDTAVYYLYAESLTGSKTTAEHAADCRENDPLNTAEYHGGAKSETQQRRDFRDAGIYMPEPDISSIDAGIERVYALFRQNRLIVFDTCIGVRDELGSYRRKIGTDGAVYDEIMDQRRYHRLDALRYAAAAMSSSVWAPAEMFAGGAL